MGYHESYLLPGATHNISPQILGRGKTKGYINIEEQVMRQSEQLTVQKT